MTELWVKLWVNHCFPRETFVVSMRYAASMEDDATSIGRTDG